MSLLRRYRWFVLAAGITLGFAVVSLTVPRGPVLTAISDIGYLLLYLAVALAMLGNVRPARGAARRFWALMAAGAILWASNQAAWVYCEVLQHVAVPDPWFMDVFLFLHLVPMIAAVGLRPHRTAGQQKFRVGPLDFLLLLVWWVFLYAFLVFPAQYVSVNVVAYDHNYSSLYMVESGVLVLVLGVAARGAPQGWKLVYLNLMAASGFYAVDSQGVNLAVTNGHYYTGSLYDIPLIGAVSWMAATALTRPRLAAASRSRPKPKTSGAPLRCGWRCWRFFPCRRLGLWAFRWDDSPASRTHFPPVDCVWQPCWCWAHLCLCASICRTGP